MIMPRPPHTTHACMAALDHCCFVAQEHGNRYVRHVRLDAPLEIVVDGLSRRGVVMKPGKPFDMYVGQVDAFMALQEGEYNSQS